jgi:serine/threonine protein kinase/tetratricopeptide (TPR) repeat protein
MIGRKLAHYSIVGKLGSGGMGEVYLAEDTRLGRRVALKLLTHDVAIDTQRLARLKREARVLASISHPGITTVFSVEEQDGTHFITMEHVEGRVLRDVIPPGGLPCPDLLEIAAPLAEALSAAHERGIVHRDLKPAHVFVTGPGRIKIIDFGLARLDAEPLAGDPGSAETGPLTDVGVLVGTVPYMSPEQLRGESAGVPSDVHALGILLFEMAAGHPPYSGRSAAELVSSILRDEPPDLGRLRRDLPSRLVRLVRACLSKTPSLRPGTAAEVCRELLAIRGEPDREDREIRSVAVLPFADLSIEKDQEYFCDGIAEELMNALNAVGELRVASRTSSFQFRDLKLDVREIGRRLNVDAILEGSVRKAGERLRVSSELVDGSSGYQLWAGRFDRGISDIFAIQEEIAQNIVQALKVSLSPGERGRLCRQPTAAVDAYEFYLRGRQFFNRYNRHGMEFALQMFARAIELDADFALAHAGIADCHSFLYANAESREEHIERALEASRRALSIDDTLADAYVALGTALSYGNRPQEARQAFETAISIDRRNFDAHYFYGRHCFISGERERAVALYDEAARLRPEDYQSLLLSAQILDDLGATQQAVEARRRGVERVEQRLSLAPDDARAHYMGANGLVALGERNRALEWARRARQLDPTDPMTLYNLACIYSMAGETDEAMACLDAALQHGFRFRRWLEHDSNLDAIRTDRRFAGMLEQLGTADG